MSKKKVVVDPEVVEASGNSIHTYQAKTLLEGADKDLADYNGKVLLVVNTASKCGLTPQYKSLQELHTKYAAQGLSILGFPSNDFMKQEPGTSEEIADFCQKNYGVEFDMFEKVKVKGEGQHPIYQFLTSKDLNGVQDSNVEWNFQKYLLDKNGKLVAIFNPRVTVDSEEVIQKIEELL
ncbi:MAG: glutathione peroxidase [Saprospiraceae bacterium]|nr:glutathione peroxidase [Saprospiraceae bacterium]